MKTKKNLYVLLASVMIFSFTDSTAQKTMFGIKAGLNLATITSNAPDFSADMRVGFHIGGGVSIGISDNFAITADLLYTTKGAKQTVEESQTIPGIGSYSSKQEETITTSYIEIPILARYDLKSGLYFNGGPYVGFLAGFKDEFTQTTTITMNGQSPTSTTESASTTDHTGWSSSDFGLKFGLGYKLAGGLDFAANYNLGISNLIDVSGYTYSARNGVIGITIGYWFSGK